MSSMESSERSEEAESVTTPTAAVGAANAGDSAAGGDGGAAVAAAAAGEAQQEGEEVKQEVPAAEEPCAVQVLNVSEDGNHFVLNAEPLQKIFAAVPHGMKVSVVSVVGAFRTGKSFVLDIFLRYLQYCEDHPDYDFASDDAPPGQSSWLFSQDTVGGTADEAGFKWRSGHERMTTGMWLWSKHFVVKRPGSDEKVALFVMDTQGLYDHDTSEQLTTSIFGLSTLISSYLVFNVSLQIQEDNLKSLALFSEYARVALHANRDESAADGAAEAKGDDADVKVDAPFQTVEFLVRDSRLRGKTMEDKLQEMSTLMDKIMGSDANEDIRSTRSQVLTCFDSVKGFFLPYPGVTVSESDTYDGGVNDIRPLFREMVEEYIRQLFCEKLNVKVVHGREVTATELYHFFVAYSKSFAESTIFPKAESLLIATAATNNRNFADRAVEAYTAVLEQHVGPKCDYVATEKLKEVHNQAFADALQVYSDGATFGPVEMVREQRVKLEADITASFKRYEETNKSRDPLSNMELYIFGFIVAIVAYVLRVISDTTCGGLSDVCDGASNFLSMIYVVIFVFFLISIAVSSHVTFGRFRALVRVFGVPLLAKATGHKPKTD